MFNKLQGQSGVNAELIQNNSTLKAFKSVVATSINT